jgi:hypothetical protein
VNQQPPGSGSCRSWASRWAGGAIRIAAFLILAASLANAADQRLILKDGTDQLVKSYEITGDRVRYYSTERQEWEEIPAALVDWDATEQAKRDAEKLPEIEAEKNKPDPRRVLAPGVILPLEEGVYAFDGRTVLPLGQSQAVITNDLKRRILSMVAPLPGVVKGHAWILLPGASAAQSVTEAGTVIYLQLSSPAKEGYALVRLQPKQDNRIVGEMAIGTLTHSLTESRQVAPTTMEEIIPAENGQPAVARLAPKSPLEPGEYAVVEFVAKDKQNLFVWDFRYSPQAENRP